MGSFASEGLTTNGTGKCLIPEGKDAIERVIELQEELQRLHRQFAEYRQTVDKTLESRWNSVHVSEEPNGSIKSNDNDTTPRHDDSHYFNSYSSNGQSI